MRDVRPTRAAATAAALLLTATALAAAPTVLADTSAADADTVTAGIQASRDLGTVAPGATLHVPVDLVLTCSGFGHADDGTTVTVSVTTSSVPLDGSATMDPATIGPVSGFPADGQDCASPAQTATAPATVDLVAPTADGGPYEYTLLFAADTSNGDGGAISDAGALTLTLRVVSNTPPTLHLPASFTVEGNEANGATVTYTATATDAQDATPPTPTCTPASGAHFALGTTTVTCSATDTGGLTTTGSFDVTVVDTTAPTLANVPAAITATTTDTSGAAVSYATPTASDLVDPNPSVGCAPASGSTFPVGTTHVTCTATDASGNHASAGFDVTVHVVRVAFDAPIGPSNVVASNGSRSLPVKARAWIDGVEQTGGSAVLVVSACDGGPSVASVPVTWSDGRWTAKVDTSAFGAGSWRATLVVNGLRVGSFDFGQVR